MEASRRHAWLAQGCLPSRSSVHSFVHPCVQRGWSCIRGLSAGSPRPWSLVGLEAASSSLSSEPMNRLRAGNQAPQP